MVLISHGHYTVDILIAYYVTTRLWYIYHTMANNVQLKVSLHLLSLPIIKLKFFFIYIFIQMK
jgi:hypothetical protein